MASHPVGNAEDLPYSEWVDGIGKGRGPEVAIDEMLPIVHEADELINFAFPDHILHNPASGLKRYILTTTNEQAKLYNDRILNRVDGDGKTCFAADSIKGMEDPGFIPPAGMLEQLDYFASQAPPGFPDHKLTIKPNAMFRLLKDISIGQKLVKNGRVIVTQVGTRIVTVRVIPDRSLQAQPDSEDVFLPRIPFSHQLPSGHTFSRRQFPLAPAYATTIEDCQAYDLDRVAIDLTRPVYAHGQLYTALSKISNRTDGLVRLPPGKNTTKNVVYKELLL